MTCMVYLYESKSKYVNIVNMQTLIESIYKKGFCIPCGWGKDSHLWGDRVPNILGIKSLHLKFK